ncbi:MAG: damage-control phosphatase ARMT1 family protein [Fibrobacterota bacterium]
MKTYLECIPCFIQQGHKALETVSTGSSEEKAEVMKEILAETARLDLTMPPPQTAQKIHRIIRSALGVDDPYYAVKKMSTRVAKELMYKVKNAIYLAEDSFQAAVRYAIAGNSMDYAIYDHRDEHIISRNLDKVSFAPINLDHLAELKEALTKAESILICGDNAGETVFDRLLIEVIRRDVNEGARITYAVKGAPIINDALREDAEEAGLHEVSTIIDNGSDAPGTLLSDCSSEFRSHFETADVVIAKGQANYETLSDVSRDIFFLTQIKCPVIADMTGHTVGDWLVESRTALSRETEAL